jgi:hypothetical protein
MEKEAISPSKGSPVFLPTVCGDPGERLKMKQQRDISRDTFPGKDK